MDDNSLKEKLATFLDKKIETYKEEITKDTLAKNIFEEFGYPFLKESKAININSNGKKKLTTDSISKIIELLKTDQKFYDTLVNFLVTHLNWLYIYCSGMFEKKKEVIEPIKENFESYEKNFKKLNKRIINIRNLIIKYINLNYIDIKQCDSSTSLSDLVKYDNSDDLSEQMRTAYIFLSVFRLRQSSEKKNKTDDSENFCILLNHFLENINTLLSSNENKILQKIPINNKLSSLYSVKKIGGDDLKKKLSGIHSDRIKDYGVFILENIINELVG